MKRSTLIALSLAVAGTLQGAITSHAAILTANYTYNKLAYNGQASGTTAYGVSNGTVVGTYGSGKSYMYTNGVYTPLVASFNGVTVTATTAQGISNKTIVGKYTATGTGAGTYGFMETGGVYTSLSDPYATTTSEANAFGISGNYVVGQYNGTANGTGAVGYYGFVADVSSATPTYTTIKPSDAASNTVVTSISGTTAAGYYTSTSLGAIDSFYFDVTNPSSITALTFTALATQLGITQSGTTGNAQGVHGIYVYGASGTTLAGKFVYANSGGTQFTYGFTYNTTSGLYTELNAVPGSTANSTVPYGIDGSTIVGIYTNVGPQAFEILPEPASLSVLGMGTVALLAARRRERV